MQTISDIKLNTAVLKNNCTTTLKLNEFQKYFIFSNLNGSMQIRITQLPLVTTMNYSVLSYCWYIYTYL